MLYIQYKIQPLFLRYGEHISCVMHRQSKMSGMLDYHSPWINLRNIKKIKFMKKSRWRYELYLKSPKVCVKVWEMLPAGVQKATTKVKFEKV